MKKLIAIVAVSAACAAATTAAHAGITVRSGALESGGVAISHAGRSFVVTSHHRIVPVGGTHTVEEPGGKPVDAKLLAWDWGSALALLEVPASSVATVALENLAKEPAEPFGKARVEQPGGTLDGKILVGSTDRHHLVALPPAFEIKASGLDERSPGSPVRSESGAVIGLISHQALVIVPGHGAIISNWPFRPHDDAIARLGLGIEASFVRAFVEKYLASSAAWRPFIEAKPEHAMAPKSIVSVGGLAFKQKCPLYKPNGELITDEHEGSAVGGGNGKADEIGGGNGAGVGGGNGAGVGGGNGAGVGGSSDGIPDKNGCSIEVTRDDENQSPWPYAHNRARFAALRAALQPGERAMIPFSYRREAGREAYVHRFVSLQHFFRQMEKKERIEVIILQRAGDRMRELAAELEEHLPEHSFKTGAPAKSALERMHFMLSLLSSMGRLDVLPSDLDPFVVPADDKNAFFDIFGHDVERSPNPPYPLISTAHRIGPARAVAVRVRAYLVQLHAKGRRSPASLAAPSTVKIYSECPNQQETYEGSGLAFRHGTKSYVVTSDHVVFHSNAKGFRHRVYSKAIGELGAKYLLSDWAKGIALLEVLGPAPKDVGPLPQASEAKPGDAVETTGYPFASSALVRDPSGKLEPHCSRMTAFFGIPCLVEIVDSHGEYGMSGGPVFDTSSRLVGLISNLAIGKSPAGEASSRLALIPGSLVVAWAQGYLSDPASFAATLVKSAYSQRHGWLILQRGGLSLYLSCFTKNHDERSTYGNACEMEISLLDPASAPRTDSTPGLERIRKYLVENPGIETLTISGFREKSVWDGRLRPIQVQKHWLEMVPYREFFTLLERWMAGEIAPFRQTAPKDYDRDALARALSNRPGSNWREAPDVEPVLDTLQELLESRDTGPLIWMLRPSDLDRALDLADPSVAEQWKLYRYAAADLQARLTELRDALRKVELKL